MHFDSVQIGASDWEEGLRQYTLLLGRAPTRGDGCYRFQLESGGVEIIGADAGVRSLRFAPEVDERSNWPIGEDAYHGVAVHIDGRAEELAEVSVSPDVPHAIDHVVIQSPNLDRAIALWRDRLGVRLALDREFPQRGVRLVFFRSGGVTLEFAGAIGSSQQDGRDILWGVAYRVADLAACRARLMSLGVVISEVRPGNKKDTIVATVKSHALGVPTLLIQPT